MLNRKAQSTLEYVIILTAIIAVILVFAAGFMRTKIKGSLEHVATEMDKQVSNVQYQGTGTTP